MAAAFLGVATITNTAYVVLALRASPVHFSNSRPLWPDLLRQGLPVGIGGLLTLGYGYVDQVIVFELAGPRDAGLYGAVYRIYERIQFLPAAIMTTLFPLFVAARDTDPDRVRRLFQTAIDYLLLTSLPALAITLAGPEPITDLLFGSDFEDAAPALPLLMATFVVVSLGYLTGYLIVAYGLQRQFVLIAIGALVFNVATNLALVPSYGFMAAAWLTLATEILVMSLSMWIVSSAMGLAPTGAHLGRIVVAAAATGLAAWGLKEAGLPTIVWTAAGERPLRPARRRARGRQAGGAARPGAQGRGVSDPLHVAVDANVLEADWGGIPKHLHRIASELVARGDRVDLLVNLRRWESPVEGAHAVPLRLRGRELWRDLAVPLWALRRRPDVLWAPETALPRRIGVPTVATVHDLAPLLFPGSKPPPSSISSAPRSRARCARPPA